MSSLITFTLQNIPHGDYDTVSAEGNPIFAISDSGFSEGDYVLLLCDMGGTGSDTHRRVLDADDTSVTLSGTLTPVGGAVYFLCPPFKGTWAYVQTTSNGEGGAWLRMEAFSSIEENETTATAANITYSFDPVLIDGETVAGDELPETLDVDACTIYLGLTPCDIRRYFDLDQPTQSKRLIEAWATMDSVTDHHFHVYEEFDLTLVPGNSSKLLQLSKPRLNTASSLCWNNKTTLKSSFLTSFGFELSERGDEEWRILNYTLKFRAGD